MGHAYRATSTATMTTSSSASASLPISAPSIPMARYCGDDGIPVQAIKRWNIGGKSYKAQDHVIAAVTISKATPPMTLKQEQSIALLKTRWSTVGPPTSLPCDDAVLVRVSSDSTGVSMVLGIETDGHIHS